MDFTTTDEQRALADATRGVLSRHGSPAAESGASAQPPAHDTALWQALVELGIPAMPWSEEDGGVGAGITDLAAAATELGRGRIQAPLAETVLAGTLVARLAPAELRQQVLGAVSEGEALLVPALDEPMRTFDPTPHDVRAEEGADGWQVTGVKAPVRYAPAATHVVLTARTASGTGVFLLSDPGATAERLDLDGTSVTLLAEGEAAEEALRDALAVAGALLCAEALGAMEEALRMTTDYLRTRKQFGVPLAAFQALTHRAADMYAQLELARSATLFAAMSAEESPVDVDAVLRARVVVDKAARLIGQEAIQLHGGIGVTAEYPVGHLSARLTMISRTWGSTRSHLATLGSRVAEHRSVDVLG
ncbi:acyl-CoA dehydrogenase family protein [Janibacter melonis]|uniref:acyl-CoA dehydrogenase family protein n=1 Tax=Janibacter melonis TaxID=262209 RepID=UPI001918B9CA|nr:acyl-CoA dehydrogenase family protein [Janibacter melonis]